MPLRVPSRVKAGRVQQTFLGLPRDLDYLARRLVGAVIPDAVRIVLARQRTILFVECAQFGPLPESGADLPIGDRAQN